MKFNALDFMGKPLLDWNDKPRAFVTEEMVEEVCAPEPYSSAESFETLEARVYKVQKLIAVLIEQTSTREQAEELFSKLSNYKVVTI